MSADLDDDDYGTEIDYDEDLENVLQKVEANASAVVASPASSSTNVNKEAVADIEDAPVLSPIQQFRKRGFLSVSDLVATVWCEVQYDYRLRTLPFLPPEKRPEVIKSTKGVEIKVDKVKEAKKEKVLKRGEKVHEKLEREIFPVKISIKTTTPEDNWGLRLLTMISALEVLISGGKCRELPVVGFVGNVLVYGIIDEIVREPLADTPSPNGKSKGESSIEGMRQTSLDTFLVTSSPRPRAPPPRTHVIRVSDSKTRAGGTLPKPEDSIGGRLQVMLYKELLDALLRTDASVEQEQYPLTLLPTAQSSVLSKVFATLGLDPDEPFSENFKGDAAALVFSNGLRNGAREATTLAGLVSVWEAYVGELGLGPPSSSGDGIADNTLALVYRRATGTPKSRRRSKRVKSTSTAASRPRRSKRRRGEGIGRAPQSGSTTETEVNPTPAPLHSLGSMDEDTQLQLALQLSLADQAPPSHCAVEEDSDAELELAIKLSLEGVAQGVDHESSARSVVDVDGTDDAAVTSAPSSPLDPLPVESQLSALHPSIDCALAGLSAPSLETGSQLLSFASSTRQDSIIGKREATSDYDTDSELEQQYDQLALAAELSQSADVSEGPGIVHVPASSQESKQAKVSRSSSPEKSKAGDIIGTTKFSHDKTLLANHLHSVLGYWKGEREPQGVGPADVRRCTWCEFEEGCEWRAAKAEEAWNRYRSRQNSVM